MAGLRPRRRSLRRRRLEHHTTAARPCLAVPSVRRHSNPGARATLADSDARGSRADRRPSGHPDRRRIDSPRLCAVARFPARDPFQAYAAPATTHGGPRAAQVLSLTATWRQTGSELAVLNGQVLGEGDEISDLSWNELRAIWFG